MAASFYSSPLIGATTTLACFAHEIPHEIADYSILVRSGFTKRQAMRSQFITAIGAFVSFCRFILVWGFFLWIVVFVSPSVIKSWFYTNSISYFAPYNLFYEFPAAQQIRWLPNYPYPSSLPFLTPTQSSNPTLSFLSHSPLPQFFIYSFIIHPFVHWLTNFASLFP